MGTSSETDSSDDAFAHALGVDEPSGAMAGPVSQGASSDINENRHSTSMLHVHAPHEIAPSWKGILVQLMVITIGLLLALLLEQLVEYAHHRHQVAEMRVRLRQETLRNVEVVQYDLTDATAALQSVEAAVRTLPSDDDAAKVAWHINAAPALHVFLPEDAAWLMMRDSGLLGLVPATLAQDYWKLEITLEVVRDAGTDARRSFVHLRAALSGTASGPLGVHQAQLLREAFTEYAENVRVFENTLKSLGLQYNKVLAGQSLYFKDVIREENRQSVPQ